MFGKYQTRKAKKKEIKVKQGNMQSNAMWCVIVPATCHDKLEKDRKDLSAGLSVHHVGLLQMGCKKELPLKLVHQIKEEKCICSNSFYLSLLIVQDTTPKQLGCISSPFCVYLRRQKLHHTLKCFIRDQEKRDDSVWAVGQNEREIEKLLYMKRHIKFLFQHKGR